MFEDDFYRRAKWWVVVIDLAIIAFLSSRLVETVGLLLENGDVRLFTNFTVAHFWSIALVVFAFGCLFLYWLNRLNLEDYRAGSDASLRGSTKQIGFVFGVVAIVVVGIELAVTYRAFSLANSNPYAVADPPAIDQLLNFLFAALAVGVHVISAFLTAKTYVVVFGQGLTASDTYIPPSQRETNE